jgi:hypothetical protein
MNWQNERNFDDSYDDPYTASPPTYSSDPYGFDYHNDNSSYDLTGTGIKSSSAKGNSGKPKQNKSDIYDYDFSNDEDISPPKSNTKIKNKKKAKTTTASSLVSSSAKQPIRRMSTDERMNEILAKSKIHKPITSSVETADTGGGDDEDEDAYSSWKSSWNQLIEGVGGSSEVYTSTADAAPLTADSDDSPVIKGATNSKKKPHSLDTSDSFEISEGDFEVPRSSSSFPISSYLTIGWNLCCKKKSREN